MANNDEKTSWDLDIDELNVHYIFNEILTNKNHFYIKEITKGKEINYKYLIEVYIKIK